MVLLKGDAGVFRPRIRVPREGEALGSPAEGNAIFFDGYCGLCNRWVDVLLRADTAGIWKFAPLQSRPGAQLLRLADLSETYTDSVVVVRDGYLYTHSTAIIVALIALGGWYRAARLLLVIPTFVRDPLYAGVARFRYRVFGRSQTCRMPTPEERSRFLEV